MTTEPVGELVHFSEILGFARRRLPLIAIGFILGSILGFVGSGYIPKKYKSRAIFTIQSGYFHHPLISDIVAEIQDTGEMSSQRAALLRLSLNDTFLESFGRSYLSSNSDPSAGTKPIDHDSVLRRIEYFSTNPTTFQISVTTASPATAANATNELLTHIVSTLERQRQQLLTSAQRALVREATLLQRALAQGDSSSAGDSSESQTKALQAELAALQGHLAETHPDIISLKKRLDSLSSRTPEARSPTESNDDGIDSIFFSNHSRGTSQEIVDDLLKKIASLSTVLRMQPPPGQSPFVDIIEYPRVPTAAFSPNRIQFALIGAAIGLMTTLSIAIVFELRRASQIRPTEAAAFLNMQLLGELPDLPRRLSHGARQHQPTSNSTLFLW